MERCDLEKQILSKFIFLDSIEQQAEYLAQMRLDDFGEKEHICVFTNITKLLSDKRLANFENLSFSLKNSAPEAFARLSEIMCSCYSLSNLGEDIKLLRELSYKEMLLIEIRDADKFISTSGFHDDIEIRKDLMIARVSGMSLYNKISFMDFSSAQNRLIQQLNSNNTLEGYSWGESLIALDNLTKGIVESRLFVIGGVKKSGKTRFLIHTLKNLYYQDVSTAFLSLEMPEPALMKMLTASFLDINEENLNSAQNLTHEELKRVLNFNIDMNYLKIECKSGLYIKDIISRIKMYSKLGVKVILIDFLQRIVSKNQNRADELEDMCKRIADATRENNVAVILLSQLNNYAEKEEPSIAHLKGSGGIGEAADTIILLDNKYRRSKAEQDRNKFNLILEQRYGESDKIEVYADLGRSKFTDTYSSSLKEHANVNFA